MNDVLIALRFAVHIQKKTRPLGNSRRVYDRLEAPDDALFPHCVHACFYGYSGDADLLADFPVTQPGVVFYDFKNSVVDAVNSLDLHAASPSLRLWRRLHNFIIGGPEPLHNTCTFIT